MVKCWGICFSLCSALCSPPQRTRGGSNTAATVKKEDNPREIRINPQHRDCKHNFITALCVCSALARRMPARRSPCLHWILLWRACHHLQSVSGTPPPGSREGWGSTSWTGRETWGGGPLSARLRSEEYMTGRLLTFPYREHYNLSLHLQKQAPWLLRLLTSGYAWQIWFLQS